MNFFDPFGALSGGGGNEGLLGGAMDYFLGKPSNPAEAAMPYYGQIPGTLNKYLDPYIQTGQQALPGLQEQYGQLMNNPGGRLNQIGQGYQQSPGFKFALQQALQGAGNAAAAGGMAGSPQHEYQNMQLATNLANQDYNTWLQNALGLYGKGVGGEEGLYGIGAKAGIGMGEDLASMLASQAQLAYAGEAAKNQAQGQRLGNVASGIGALAAFL